MLGQIEDQHSERLVVADMEAGAGTLTRMPRGSLDVLLLVVEASAKSIDVARRALAIITERQIGVSLVVANRIRDADDLALVHHSFPMLEIVAVPEDPIVSRSDREARSPVDVDPRSLAVQAVDALAGRLNHWIAVPTDGEIPVIAPRS
ncbi:MAG: hypothetical protein NVSMB2_11090 [Chloroflexota bacterium]